MRYGYRELTIEPAYPMSGECIRELRVSSKRYLVRGIYLLFVGYPDMRHIFRMFRGRHLPGTSDLK
jgi:hypothetical protein